MEPNGLVTFDPEDETCNGELQNYSSPGVGESSLFIISNSNWVLVSLTG